MRAFFAILLLLNLGFLAYQLWTGSETPLPARPLEVNAEKILVLDPARLPAPQPGRPAALDAPDRSAAARMPPAPPGVPGAQCFHWGTFEPAALARAEELLTQRLPEIRHTRGAPDGVARFWVFIPSAGSAQETQARLQRLKRKGAGDVVVIREDDPELSGAVSLGIYSSAAAAQRRMAELERLRIRGARVVERRSSAGFGTQGAGAAAEAGAAVQLTLRNVDPALRPNLEALVREIDNSELREVACPAALAQQPSEPSR